MIDPLAYFVIFLVNVFLKFDFFFHLFEFLLDLQIFWVAKLVLSYSLEYSYYANFIISYLLRRVSSICFNLSPICRFFSSFFAFYRYSSSSFCRINSYASCFYLSFSILIFFALICSCISSHFLTFSIIVFDLISFYFLASSTYCFFNFIISLFNYLNLSSSSAMLTLSSSISLFLLSALMFSTSYRTL